MSHSNSVQARNLKPFKKGPDAKRHKFGRKSLDRAAWTTLFLNALAERLDPKEAANLLATAYEARRPWAVVEVHERLMGKVTQPISGEVNGKHALTIRVVQVKDQNGNGNTGQ